MLRVLSVEMKTGCQIRAGELLSCFLLYEYAWINMPFSPLPFFFFFLGFILGGERGGEGSSDALNSGADFYFLNLDSRRSVRVSWLFL